MFFVMKSNYRNVISVIYHPKVNKLMKTLRQKYNIFLQDHTMQMKNMTRLGCFQAKQKVSKFFTYMSKFVVDQKVFNTLRNLIFAAFPANKLSERENISFPCHVSNIVGIAYLGFKSIKHRRSTSCAVDKNQSKTA